MVGGEVRNDNDMDTNKNLQPLLGTGCVAEVNHQGAVFVLVFSTQEYGVTKNHKGEEVSEKNIDDLKQATKDIFPHEDPENFVHGFPSHVGDSASSANFRKLAKEHLEKLLKDFDVEIATYRSIDGDVEFWVLSMADQALHHFADQCQYVLPLTRKAYEAIDAVVPTIEDQIAMHAHVGYSEQIERDWFQFQGVDHIRIMSMLLSSSLNLNALVKHEVIQRWFPVAGYDEMVSLTQKMVAFRKKDEPFSFFPQGRDVDDIRSYFGEEIAGFFDFYGSLQVSMLFPFCAAAFVFAIDMARPMGMTRVGVNTWRAVFAGVMMCWGTWICSMAEHAVSRNKMRWGTEGSKSADVVLPDYVPPGDKVSLWSVRLNRVYGQLITGLFLFVVVIVCCELSVKIPYARIATIVQTAVTFLFSFAWGKLAYHIVQSENKRTQGKFNKSLAMRLSFVKLFIFFFPLVRLAFLEPVAEKVCVDENAATETNKTFASNETLYKHYFDKLEDKQVSFHGFAEYMTTKNKIDKSNPALYAVTVLSDLKTYSGMLRREDDDDARTIPECYRGCFPMECEETRIGVACWDTCYDKLKNNLISLFLTHAVSTIVFVLYPMFQVRWMAQREMMSAAQRGDSDKLLADSEQQTTQPTETSYTLIEFQEKCHQFASYEYGSWGGSYVEDFLEVVLSFSVLVCFAVVSPTMAMFGFVAACVEYRLLAFRMLWVTCRPFPAESEGMDEWLSILDAVLFIATGMNSLLLVTVLHTDLDLLRPSLKLLSVFLATLGFITVRVVMRILLQEQPQDIINADDVNHMFLSDLRMKVRKETSVVLKSPEQNQDEPENVEQDADDGIMGLVSGRSWTSVSRIRLRGFGLFR